jgi:hypothetical protein
MKDVSVDEDSARDLWKAFGQATASTMQLPESFLQLARL